jgi:cell division protein FtsB
VRYWEADRENSVEVRRSAFRDFRPRSRPTGPNGAVVTGGGSVGPFLRRFYHHQVVVSQPVRRFFLFLLMAGLIYAFVLGEGGAIRIVMLRHERSALDRSNAELARHAALLESEIALLESDRFYIEKTGRERYGYIKPGDKVYKIVEPAKEAEKSK